jgi:cobalamin transport system substrate-binding protein
MRIGRLLASDPVRVLVLVAVLAGWAEAREVRDMVGRAVRVPDRPERVVSLAPSLTETAFALGAGERVVGVTDHDNFPPEVAGKSRIGGVYTPSLEAILSLRPDLILATSEGNREEHIRALEQLGVPVYVCRPVDLPSVLESVERLGGLLGRDREAARVVAGLRHDADGIARAVAGAPRPRVLYVIWGSPLIVAGRDTMITDLIRRAGGESVTGDEATPYPRLSVEEALARRPDWIIIGQHGGASVEARLREWTSLSLLPAAREGRVRAIDGDLVHRPGPRIVEALRALARILHPERVP